MQVSGMVAVVSGGASGLGEATCRLLAAKGAKIAIFDVAENRGQRLAAELGKTAIFCQTDVADTESVQQAVDQTMRVFGAVHAAVNCAGISTASRVFGKKGLISMELFNKVIQVNLIGTMNVIRSTVEQMAKNSPTADGERGVVINTSSGAAFEGQIGQAAYSASKAAVVGLTLPLAREFAEYGIRVATIAPGLFETPMASELPEKVRESLLALLPFPKRMGKPVEFAMLCRQIIENPMLNGRTIRLDGAVTMQAR